MRRTHCLAAPAEMLPSARQKKKLQINAPSALRVRRYYYAVYPLRTAHRELRQQVGSRASRAEQWHRTGPRPAGVRGVQISVSAGTGLCNRAPHTLSLAAAASQLRSSSFDLPTSPNLRTFTHSLAPMAAFHGTWAETLLRVALIWSILVYAVLASGKLGVKVEFSSTANCNLLYRYV